MRRAEEAQIVMPLSEWRLELNVANEHRISTITLHKWITSDGRVTKYNRQSETLNKDKQTRNLREAEFIARSIDMTISTGGWKTVSKYKYQEVKVQRLLAVELVASGRSWAESILIEEPRV